jgi:hypothetical protein
MSATAEAEKTAPVTQMPLFEGYRVSEHRLNFAGNILLIDADVLKQMHLKNNDVELVIRGKVVARSHKKLSDKDGNTTGAVSSTSVYVESVSAYEG